MGTIYRLCGNVDPAHDRIKGIVQIGKIFSGISNRFGKIWKMKKKKKSDATQDTESQTRIRSMESQGFLDGLEHTLDVASGCDHVRLPACILQPLRGIRIDGHDLDG